ncbi:hypothetical protein D3C71_2195890 [compost metagenome]
MSMPISCMNEIPIARNMPYCSTRPLSDRTQYSRKPKKLMTTLIRKPNVMTPLIAI